MGEPKLTAAQAKIIAATWAGYIAPHVTDGYTDSTTKALLNKGMIEAGGDVHLYPSGTTYQHARLTAKALPALAAFLSKDYLP